MAYCFFRNGSFTPVPNMVMVPQKVMVAVPPWGPGFVSKEPRGVTSKYVKSKVSASSIAKLVELVVVPPSLLSLS